ncbi:hypothetical protein BD414DRAFT_539163 [Trametes punicea]|nr:hypothetical protein BD414DRAFT_539163 [Trametes punicea]
MTTQACKAFEIAIVGGGVSGLTCAVALQKAGLSVRLFEAAPALGEIGAGVAIGPNAVRILRDMGVLDPLLQKCGPGDLRTKGFAYYNGVGEHRQVHRIPAEDPYDREIGVHRADFIEALASAADHAMSYLNKRCISITDSPANPKRVLLSFLDGTTHTHFTRGLLLRSGAKNLPDGAPWVEQVTREEVKQEFAGWGPDVAILLDHMPERPSKWSIHVVDPPLESYARGHSAELIGASRLTGCQGIEDAYLLARLLGHPHTNIDNLEVVLQVYSQIRRPRAQMVWDGSRLMGRLYDGDGPHGTDWGRVAEDVRDMFLPVWRHDHDRDFEAAVASLRERGLYPVDDGIA